MIGGSEHCARIGNAMRTINTHKQLSLGIVRLDRYSLMFAIFLPPVKTDCCTDLNISPKQPACLVMKTILGPWDNVDILEPSRCIVFVVITRIRSVTCVTRIGPYLAFHIVRHPIGIIVTISLLNLAKVAKVV